MWTFLKERIIKPPAIWILLNSLFLKDRSNFILFTWISYRSTFRSNVISLFKLFISTIRLSCLSWVLYFFLHKYTDKTYNLIIQTAEFKSEYLLKLRHCKTHIIWKCPYLSMSKHDRRLCGYLKNKESSYIKRLRQSFGLHMYLDDEGKVSHYRLTGQMIHNLCPTF